MRLGGQKQKGNLFENKCAKMLSNWMFGNPNMLNRSITSGAKKNAYLGDIVPQMQLLWTTFPFIIENKHGYKGNIPNLNNQNIVRNWIDKVINERGNQELIIYLIIKFHGYSTLFATDVSFEGIVAPIILNHQMNGTVIPFFFYNFGELLTKDFYELYKNNTKLNSEVFKT